ncbi:MAG: Ldh family oxidoreductase [Chloroflexota bacterium]|nr:Ldh family oxidoreductase [Chloroflexota bacterium]
MEKVRAAATVPWQEAVDFAAQAFAATGVPQADARKAGEALVDADLHGTVTHGLKNLRNYVSGLLDGRINPRPNMHDVGGGKAARVITADNGLGHVAGHVGMQRAIELAREYGVGTVMMRDSNHYGASGYWARLPLRHNMIGFAFTTASARIAPWGGKEALVGNNPPAWAVPSRVVAPDAALSPAETESMFLDVALSVVAGNRLDIYRRRGEPIPAGWALDRNGEPTTDPVEANQGGTYAPLADYKGSGIAILLSAINSFLAGAAFDDQRPRTGNTNHWFAAYDIAQFVDPERFTGEVRGVRERVQRNPPRRGFDRVLAPGDLENEKAQLHQREGIPFEQFTLDDLEWIAEHTGVPLKFRSNGKQ